jgi:zinc transport system ATP-binding protein
MPIVDHSKNIIEVKDIFFSYDKEEILKGINLNIHKGDYLAIIGPNGSGKTTLIKIILGLLRPDKGSIKLFGKNIKEFKEWSKVGYVPQKAANFDLNFPATVKEVVSMGRFAKKGLFYGLNKEDDKIVEESIRQVSMQDYENHLIGDLSGGQQQRVFIARALSGKPEIIFLDESTAGIDKKSQDDFYSLLSELNKKFGLTLVLVSHDIERMTKEAMHIACVDRTLVCHTSPAEFLKNSEIINLYHNHNN